MLCTITINQKNVCDFNNTAFSLRFEKYKNNILIENDSEIIRKVLSPQYFTFFKSISNLSVNDSIVFEDGSTNNTLQKNILCAKIYKSHDFYSLYNSFPTDKNGFDIKLGTVEHWGSFSYKIKKQDDTQKGILFGFFIEAEDSTLPLHSSDIRLRAYKAEKNIDENYKNNNGRSDGRDWGWDNTEKDENRASDSSKPFPIAMIIAIVVIFIGIIFLIICCVLNSQKNRNRRRNNSSNQVCNENNNITQKKNYNDNNDNNYYNSINDNNYNNDYYKNVEYPSGNACDDYPACPAINEN